MLERNNKKMKDTDWRLLAVAPLTQNLCCNSIYRALRTNIFFVRSVNYINSINVDNRIRNTTVSQNFSQLLGDTNKSTTNSRCYFLFSCEKPLNHCFRPITIFFEFGLSNAPRQSRYYNHNNYVPV